MSTLKTLHLYLIGQPLSEMVRIVTGLTRSTLDHPKLDIGLDGRMHARIRPIRTAGPNGVEKTGDDILQMLAPLLTGAMINPDWPFQVLPVSDEPGAKTLPGLEFIFVRADDDGNPQQARNVRVFLVADLEVMKRMAREDDPDGTHAYFPEDASVERSILFMAMTLHATSVSTDAKHEELLVGIASAVFDTGMTSVSSGMLVLTPMELALLHQPIAVQQRAEAIDQWGATGQMPEQTDEVANDLLPRTLYGHLQVGPKHETTMQYAVMTSDVIAGRAALFKLLGILENWRGSPPDHRNSTGSAIMLAPYGVIEDGQINLHSASKPGHCIPLFDERGSVFEDTRRADTPALIPQGGQMPHLALLFVHDPFFMAAFDLMNPWATDYQLVLDVMDARRAAAE